MTHPYTPELVTSTLYPVAQNPEWLIKVLVSHTATAQTLVRKALLACIKMLIALNCSMTLLFVYAFMA
jgi:hypothetical protein